MLAKVIKIDPQKYNKEILVEPAMVLAEGGLVAFPTETVYGLGTNANIPWAVKRLSEVKNSPEGRPFTFHLASGDDIYRYTTKVPRLALRLMRAYWPGAITLVLPSANNWIGLRVPDHFVARDLINFSKVSVVAASANIAEEQPPTDAQTIIKTLGDKIDIIIDAGPSRVGISSTVVKIPDDNKFEILRDGSITKNDIHRFTYKMILFICSGNTCRSPMASGLLKKILSNKLNISIQELENKGYKIISAGTSAIYNSSASNNAITVMKEIDVDISDHRSQPVTLTMIEEADEIYVMTKGHLTTLKEWVPLIAERIKLLDPSGEDISDPIILDKDGYQSTLNKIKQGLDKIIKEIK
jgi:protein-tyrosine phosphatase